MRILLRTYLPLLLLTGIFLSSCKKEEEGPEVNPPISDTPAIEFVTVNKTTVQQFEDSLVFSITYTDGNGDLGFESADSMSIYLEDERGPIVTMYHLQPLVPEGTDLTIQGTLDIVLEHTILLDENASQETAVFKIKLRDRAGQWSNEVSSPSITVTP